MAITYLTLNTSDISGLKDRIAFRTVNTIIAVGCILSNFVVLSILLSYRTFRNKCVLLIQLSAGDMIFSIATVYIGSEQICIYSTAISTLKIPLRTTTDCLLNIGLQLKLIGDILVPVTILWMGLERFTAVTFPLFYRTNVDRTQLKTVVVPFISGAIVIFFLVWALLSVLNSNRPSSYYCGRKTTFGQTYTLYIYFTSIVCNIASTSLNAIAYVEARIAMKKNPRRTQYQLDVIWYYLLISILSTILVAVPNMKSLYQVYVHRVSDTLSKSLEWMQTLSSGVNVFVYILFNKEFRQRVIQILQKGKSAGKRFKENFARLLSTDMHKKYNADADAVAVNVKLKTLAEKRMNDIEPDRKYRALGST